MKLQIELTPALKQAAEARAREMGYSSLAALLKVLAANLAQQYQEGQTQSAAPMPAAALTTTTRIPVPSPPPPALKPTVVQQPVIPPVEQFKVWPKHIGPSVAQRDPALYLLLIELGEIR